MLKRLNRNALATILGAITSLCTAYAVIDFSTFDIKKDWFKLVVIGMPALGGYMSSINKKKD